MRTFALGLLVACSGGPSDSADTGGDDADADVDTDADGDADADTDADADGDADSDADADTEPATASIVGTVTGPSGPLAAANLRFCRGALCRNGVTDGAGSFTFEAVPSDWHSLEVVAAPGSPLATILVPLNFAADEHRVIGLVALPLGPASALGPTVEHAMGDGLFVTLGSADIEPPRFIDPATEVAGVRLPDLAFTPTDGITGTTLAMWYLSPFDHHAVDAAGLPVRIVNDFGLAEGATVQVYVGSYELSQWVDAGTATVSGADLVGASLPLLSTVLVVQP